MLTELHVRDLGVIDDLSIVLGPGMTALTGETGAGKTLLVEAIELLVGGRGDPLLVRPGQDEARIEGRFILETVEGTAGSGREPGDAGSAPDGREVVLTRVVSRAGRSRAYVDGRLATVSELAQIGGSAIDLHGQHAHQSLLAPSVQRAALDRFGEIDLAALTAAKERAAAIEGALGELGGDERARRREMDLLRYQLGELDGAGLTDPDEDARLEAEDDRLAGATSHREAAAAALAALTGENGAIDSCGEALAALVEHRPFGDIALRLRSAQAELAESATDLREAAEAVEDDPARLDAVQTRQRLLCELRRKYGETLQQVMDFITETRDRLADLEGYAERVAALEAERREVAAAIAGEEAAVAAARREAAGPLGRAVEEQLRHLAMPAARFEVAVVGGGPGGGPGDVTFMLSANPGEPLAPLSRVASGGELARTMLAARLVLSEGPPTAVFDEVDAGIGGEAAVAVARALAALAAGRQVLVVTHLPQVAAFADHQVAITKQERGGRTVATAQPLLDDERVVELSRMLSGQPASETARGHAEELLSMALVARGKTVARGSVR